MSEPDDTFVAEAGGRYVENPETGERVRVTGEAARVYELTPHVPEPEPEPPPPGGPEPEPEPEGEGAPGPSMMALAAPIDAPVDDASVPAADAPTKRKGKSKTGDGA